MTAATGGRDRTFLRLWIGQSASLAGTQVGRLALPLVAIETLRAGPFAVSVVSTLTTLPFLVFGLAAGAWVDRRSRRRVLVVSDLVRAAALVSMPMVVVLGHRGGLGWLYLVAATVGTSTVFFDVAYDAYVPEIVTRERLEWANGRLALGETLARLAGPGLGGLLVQAATAPFAVVADGLSYLASVLSLLGLPDRTDNSARPRERLRTQLAAGLRHVTGTPVLRGLLATGAVLNLFDAGVSALLLLFLTRTLDMAPAVVGLALTVGAAGGLVAVPVMTRVRRRVGATGAMALGLACLAAARLTQAALPAGRPVLAFGLLVGSQLVAGYGAVSFNVVQVSLRQRATPDALLGRMTATMRVALWGTLPLGAALGGVLAQRWGVGRGMLAMAAGTAVAPFVLLVLLRGAWSTATDRR